MTCSLERFKRVSRPRAQRSRGPATAYRRRAFDDVDPGRARDRHGDRGTWRHEGAGRNWSADVDRVTDHRAASSVSGVEEAQGVDDPSARDPLVTEARLRLERIRECVRWLAFAPGSDVLERMLAVVAAEAARPTAEAIQRLSDELPGGPPDPQAERVRAVEAAFRAALEWAPAIARHSGDEVLAQVLADLVDAQAGYIAAILRDDYASAFTGPASQAMNDAATALEAARRLASGSNRAAPPAVGELDAQVLVCQVELRMSGTYEALKRFVDDAIEPRTARLRDLS